MCVCVWGGGGGWVWGEGDISGYLNLWFLINAISTCLCAHCLCAWCILRELHSREYLDELLSRALNLPLEMKDGHECLPLIDESSYILTLDYTIKMLSIHERRECGMPVIIEGETGVGKTALIEMLSKLWNYSWNVIQRKNKNNLFEFLLKRLQGWNNCTNNILQLTIHISKTYYYGDYIRTQSQKPIHHTFLLELWACIACHLLPILLSHKRAPSLQSAFLSMWRAPHL